MPRAGTLNPTSPYQYFGTFAGLPFWPGGLTLLAAEPGLGKTSWLLQIVHQAARKNIPAAVVCFEHSAEELKFRLEKQAQAIVAGPHSPADPDRVNVELARGYQAVLLSLSDLEDTLRVIEETLLEDYGFPYFGPALVAVDYLQRIPVVGVTGRVPEELRAGEAAADLRRLARKRGWSVIAATALKASSFEANPIGETGVEIPISGLEALLGDERVPYEADRVYYMSRQRNIYACGCARLLVYTLKNRAGPLISFPISFWGERFYPALERETNHP